MPIEDPAVHVLRHPEEENTVIVVQRARESAAFVEAGAHDVAPNGTS